MRVIAGSAKRIQLHTLEGSETRPTTDRIKETLFNMINPWIVDSLFLDLFAGSGAIGIEALSRGAMEAVFVEKNPKAVKVINENLEKTRLKESAVVYTGDVVQMLHSVANKKFDYIFMDPPYNHLLEKTALEKIAELDILSDDGIVIVEASLETDFSYLSDMGFRLVKEKIYKTNKHMFIEKDQ